MFRHVVFLLEFNNITYIIIAFAISKLNCAGYKGSNRYNGAKGQKSEFSGFCLFLLLIQIALAYGTIFVIAVAVNWFAGLRCRWQIQQAENRKKHRAMDAAPRRSCDNVSDRNCHRFYMLNYNNLNIFKIIHI